MDEVDNDGGGVDIREPGAEEGLPFLAHEEHEGCVAGGGVQWAKGHDVEGEEGAVGAGEAELLSVAVSDRDLVEAGLGVNTDPVQAARSRGKVFNSFVAAGDGECVRVTEFSLRYETQRRHIKSSMLVTCSWWGLGARTIWDNQPQRVGK